MRRPPGFTLVELLIVVAILSLLMQLALPAVEASREAARQVSCKNNLRQLAIAAQMHETSHGFLPSGGWNFTWMGDPERGFGRSQPGGWGYSILPYIERNDLHSRGIGESAEHRRRTGAEVFATPLEIFTCPSRRLSRGWPFEHWADLRNIDKPSKAGRSDYAACIGNIYPVNREQPLGPRTIEEGDLWAAQGINWIKTQQNGLVFQRSEVRISQVSDGLTSTLLVGEKFLPREFYKTSAGDGDDQSLYVGFDLDNIRIAHPDYPPLRDIADASLEVDDDSAKNLSKHWHFGSAHPEAFNMAFGDASVRSISYDVDLEVLSSQSSRDGEELSTK